MQHSNIVACILKKVSYAFYLSLKAKIRSVLSIGSERSYTPLFSFSSCSVLFIAHAFFEKRYNRVRAKSVLLQCFFLLWMSVVVEVI